MPLRLTPGYLVTIMEENARLRRALLLKLAIFSVVSVTSMIPILFPDRNGGFLLDPTYRQLVASLIWDYTTMQACSEIRLYLQARDQDRWNKVVWIFQILVSAVGKSAMAHKSLWTRVLSPLDQEER